VDERLLLNDIMPPGVHREKWGNSVTRAALTKYHNDVEQYIQKKLAPPPHVWSSHSGADNCISPAPSPAGGSTSIRLDGDDDDDDDDDQADQVLTHKERDDNDDDRNSSSSASDHPRNNGEERQKTPEPETMVEHTTPGGDPFQQQRGGNVRAHSPIEVDSQPSPLSQRAGDLSAYQGGDLSLQGRSVEVSPQKQHEQESAARGREEQEQEQGKRAPQTLQQGGQSREQGGQSPAPQAAHLTALLRKAAVGADGRVGR